MTYSPPNFSEIVTQEQILEENLYVWLNYRLEINSKFGGLLYGSVLMMLCN